MAGNSTGVSGAGAGVSVGPGPHSDPYTLTGTVITGITTAFLAWQARVHAQGRTCKELEAELWFWRRDTLTAVTGAWYPFPAPPVMDEAEAIQITQTYRQPSSLTVSILDEFGLLTPTNLESPYNYNVAGQQDILLDEARKILLRVGVRAWGDLVAGIAPTSSLVPSTGTLATLTDGIFADWLNSPATTTFVAWTPGSTAPFTQQFDLGSVQQVRHVAARFGSYVGNWTLPAAVQVLTSLDGVTWSAFPARPVGGIGSATQPPGDWDDGIPLASLGTTDNLLTYPGFETGVMAGFGVSPPAPWVAVAGTSHLGSATTSDPVHSGLNCCVLSTDGIQQAVAYSPGQPLTATAWFCEKAGTGFAATVQIVIDLLSAAGGVLHTLSGGPIVLPANGAYQQCQLDWPAPPIDNLVTQARVTYKAVSWTDKEPEVDDCQFYISSSATTVGAVDPCVTEVAVTDLEIAARHVQLVITPTGAQTIAIDEIAIFGGGPSSFLGCNLFCGYLGDLIDVGADGVIAMQATDVLKRLADNNETGITSRYGNIDIADICYALLTSPTDWRGNPGDYDEPWQPAEIGWQTGQNLTGLIMPVWQGQNNNHYGYQQELWHEVGWTLTGDGNGVLTPFSSPYRQLRPVRVMINSLDGNQDVRNCRRTVAGKDLRNVVSVSTGRPKGGSAGEIVLYDPASVSRYGHRRNRVKDPVATTPDIRQTLAAQILRDYGWRVNSLACQILPDFDTRVRDVHGFRTALRPSLYAKTCSVVGYRRKQELWMLQSITHRLTRGAWWGDCRYTPYVAQGLNPPIELTLTSSPDSPYNLTLTWQTDTDAGLAGFNVYLSTASDNGPFVLQNSTGLIGAASTSYTMAAGNTLGAQFWVYATAVDSLGHESEPGIILSILAGGSGVGLTNWVITDLAAALDQQAGPDSQGYYTYQFDLTFSSPPIPAPVPDNGSGGLVHFKVYYSFGSLPPNPNALPTQWPYSGEEWGGRRIPPGEVGTGKDSLTGPFTPGTISYQDRRRFSFQIPSGTTVYVRMFTSPYSGWSTGQTCQSNIASFVMP